MQIQIPDLLTFLPSISSGNKFPQFLIVRESSSPFLGENLIGYRIPACLFSFIDLRSQIKMEYVVFPHRADEESEGISLAS